MIALLTGKLLSKSPDSIIIDVHGVGYRVQVPLSTSCALPGTGETVTLHIHSHVREDAFKLFGFLSERERWIFEKLISVSKIGPRLGLNILSGIPAPELEVAVLRADTQRLSSVPGVGKKTAERLVIELKDKLETSMPALSAMPGPSASSRLNTPSGIPNEAVSALTNLGFSRERAEGSLATAWRKKEDNNWDLEELIRECLQSLG